MNTSNRAICIRLFFLLSINFPILICNAQDALTQKITRVLADEGYENIRAISSESQLMLTIEDNMYVWNIDGINNAIDIINDISDVEQISMIVLNRGIPQYVISLSVQNDSLVSILASCDIEDTWNKLRNIIPLNVSELKIDVVAYPQFLLQNTLLSQIYEVQLNFAPAMEVSLWKGMLFTGQVIFPLKNDLGYEGNFIRPGFVTLAQDFRLPYSWFGRAAIGNFNAGRYGGDITLHHSLANNRMSVGLNAGFTGSSHFYNGQWVTSEINTLTWFAKAGYYYPKFDLQFDLSFGCYLNNDYGFRADCTRHFGASTVGFFAMYSGGKPNGGFHLSFPLPLVNKRNRRHALRLVPAKIFDWEYNAGTEFYYGRYYETQPNENRTEQWNNLIFMKKELLKTKN